MSRSADRIGFDIPGRLTLLERDADIAEARYKELDERLDGIQKSINGVLVALTTSSILLAVNAVLQATN